MRNHDIEVLFFAAVQAIRQAELIGDRDMFFYLDDKMKFFRAKLINSGYTINNNGVFFMDDMISVNTSQMNFNTNLLIDRYLNSKSPISQYN